MGGQGGGSWTSQARRRTRKRHRRPQRNGAWRRAWPGARHVPGGAGPDGDGGGRRLGPLQGGPISGDPGRALAGEEPP